MGFWDILGHFDLHLPWIRLSLRSLVVFLGILQPAAFSKKLFMVHSQRHEFILQPGPSDEPGGNTEKKRQPIRKYSQVVSLIWLNILIQLHWITWCHMVTEAWLLRDVDQICVLLRIVPQWIPSHCGWTSHCGCAESNCWSTASTARSQKLPDESVANAPCKLLYAEGILRRCLAIWTVTSQRDSAISARLFSKQSRSCFLMSYIGQ